MQWKSQALHNNLVLACKYFISSFTSSIHLIQYHNQPNGSQVQECQNYQQHDQDQSHEPQGNRWAIETARLCSIKW